VLIKLRPTIPDSSITDESVYLDRRTFLRGAAAVVAGSVVGGPAAESTLARAQRVSPLAGAQPSPFSTTEPLTALDAITSYNNFYEFGSEKGDPARHAHVLTVSPWTIRVDGHCERPGTIYQVDDLVKMSAIEERVYRLRCVEGWSMVIPWLGVPLAGVIDQLRPTSKATFVAFQTAARTGEMPGLASPVLAWPYVEALRMDEARHPLTILAVGLYGRSLLNQNGAPIRLVVPWKYGFKSIKSIVTIRFLDRRPPTSWSRAAPADFGCFANVNPDVQRPRDQRTERRIGAFFMQRTQRFNGYADEVAHLYRGMDLVRDF
jgi:methionine sulfoxide reductase catalytic subunit